MKSDERKSGFVDRIPAVLTELLGQPGDAYYPVAGTDADAALVVSGRIYVVVFRPDASLDAVAEGATQARATAKALGEGTIAMVAVPQMRGPGREACKEAGVSWFDFQGNADILAPGVRVLIERSPDVPRERVQDVNAFASKSSRIVRWLLIHPDEGFAQKTIAEAVGVSNGLVSRVVTQLERERYLVRDENGRVRVHTPSLLLEAWREAYRFSKHIIIKGHMPERGGDALTHKIGDVLSSGDVRHAATGLSAAWKMTQYAGFRTATFYLSDAPSNALIDELDFREVQSGANVWFVIPNDEGVFCGASHYGGVRCVHPTQVYLDLKGHPERATEAAERLLKGLFGGGIGE